MRKMNWIAAVLVLAMVMPVLGQDNKTDDRRDARPTNESVAVTVYNGGYGIVRDVRSLKILDGVTKFTDVATGIDPTTVFFKSVTDPTAKLLEQNYQYDLVSADKLLNKYIDSPIDVICKDSRYSGKLLSYDSNQIVLAEEKGAITMIQRYNNVQDIRFKVLPEGLLTKPTLVWLVDTKKPGEQMVEVTYQTRGMNWHAEYVLVLNKDDSQADMTGWISVQNNCGKSFKNAKMKFIAGDVRRVDGNQRQRNGAKERRYKGKKETSKPGMVEKAFFEYHMYTLGRLSTVANNEVKQLEMFPPAAGVKIEKKFLYNPLGEWRWSYHYNYGSRYTDRAYGVDSASKKVNVFIEFENSKKNNLGLPLPGGKVRVYKQDPSDKALEFIGEEQIDHTPKDEKLSLRIGNAFDIVGERKQTNFKIDTSRRWMEETVEIKVRNHKDDDVVVRIKEPIYRWTNWEIIKTNIDGWEKLDSGTAAWDVSVKGTGGAPDSKGGEVTLTYTVKYTW